MGAVWPWKNHSFILDPESSHSFSSPLKNGVYKIAITDALGHRQLTQCLPYNTTIDQMTLALNSLSLVRQRGGVTVRNYGNQDSSLFSYGFTYHIEMDSVSTNQFQFGPLIPSIACYGKDCLKVSGSNEACYETEVIIPLQHSHYCIHDSDFSLSHSNTCVIPPVLSVSPLSSLSYCNYTGDGILQFIDSRHRLPPITDGTVSLAANAVGILAADTIYWNTYQGYDNSHLIITGTGWKGWESSYLLYSPSWKLERGYSSELLAASFSSKMILNSFSIQDSSSFLIAAPNSTLIIEQTSRWNGGTIGGLGTMLINKGITLKGIEKFLSYGLQLIIAKTAIVDWSIGDLYLGNGANITVFGKWIISSTSSAIAIHQAPFPLINTSPSELIPDTLDSLLNEVTTDRSGQSYYSTSLSSELQSGWYLNPLCGKYCLTLSQMVFDGRSNLTTIGNSQIIFNLPLNMIGDNKVNIGKHAEMSLHNGGILGNDVIVDLSDGNVLISFAFHVSCLLHSFLSLLLV
jgi:hypothetical protein